MSNGSFVSSCHQWGCSDWHYGESWGEEAIVVSCVSWATLVQRLAEISVYKATTPDAVQHSPHGSRRYGEYYCLRYACNTVTVRLDHPPSGEPTTDLRYLWLSMLLFRWFYPPLAWVLIMRTTLQRAQHCKSGKVWISTNYKLIHTFLS